MFFAMPSLTRFILPLSVVSLCFVAPGAHQSASALESRISLANQPAHNKARLRSEVDGELIVEPDSILKLLRKDNPSFVDIKSLGDVIITLRRKVTDSPSDVGLRIQLGGYLLLAGDLEGAAMELKRAVALQPRNYIAHTLLAKILDEANDRDTSNVEFQRAIEFAGNVPDVHALFGESLVYRGDLSQGINEYRRSVAIKPTCEALSGLAEALAMMHDKFGAVKAARQAVSVEPSSSMAHVALTKALLVAGNNQSALRTARQAVLLNPSSADSHIALGRALHAKNDLDRAVEEFRQAVALDPLNPQARNDLGYALYSKGDMLSAVNEFRLALRINPHLGEARNNLEIAIHGLSGRK
jgi:Flp pilus assembly protein TadD